MMRCFDCANRSEGWEPPSPTAKKEECSMTELEGKIEQLEIRVEELEEETDEDKFCEDCEFITVVADVEEFWGVKCYREYPVCLGEFYPTDCSCPRHEEYGKLCAELRAAHEELVKLLDEGLEREEDKKCIKRTRYCDWCSVTGQKIDLDELHEDCPTFEEWVDDCEGAS